MKICRQEKTKKLQDSLTRERGGHITHVAEHSLIDSKQILNRET